MLWWVTFPAMRQLQFREPLGAGAFGTVYRADLISERGFRRPVAVKVLNMSGTSESERMVSRIRDEARLLGLLQDDCILKVLDLVRVGGRDAVVMEYVEGTDLSHLMPVSRPPPRALAELGALLAGTLHRAHTARHPETGTHLQVVHRDVKPQNVMLTARGGVKLLDFGVAKAAFDSRESRTGQLVLGTLQYMAHDYILSGEVSPALDIYGLGLILGEAATGKRFGRPQLTEIKFKARLGEWLDAIPQEYDPLLPGIQRVLSWDADRRGSAAVLEGELLRIADEVAGKGLRRWCAEAVPQLMERRVEAEDLLEISGQIIPIDASAFDETSPLQATVSLTETLPKALTTLRRPDESEFSVPALIDPPTEPHNPTAPRPRVAEEPPPFVPPSPPVFTAPARTLTPETHTPATPAAAPRPSPAPSLRPAPSPSGQSNNATIITRSPQPRSQVAPPTPLVAPRPMPPQTTPQTMPRPAAQPVARAPVAPTPRKRITPVILGLMAGGGLGMLALLLLFVAQSLL